MASLAYLTVVVYLSEQPFILLVDPLNGLGLTQCVYQNINFVSGIRYCIFFFFSMFRGLKEN